MFLKIFSFFLLAFLFLYFVSGLIALNNLLYWNYTEDLSIYSFVNISFGFNLDSVSLFFLFLTTFLTLVCLLLYWHVSYMSWFYIFTLLFSFFSLSVAFSVSDLLLFFFFFELSVLPIYLLVLVWGSRERKTYAANLLLLYTLLGSILILFSLLFILFTTGSLDYMYLSYIDLEGSNILFILIFLGFAIKIPLVPLHIWLPEAHVEAPTPGSVLLAGIILKLAFYAYLRILMLFENCFDYWWSTIITLLIVGFYYPCLVAFTQYDLKKIIAYSSISHMNFALLGFFCYGFGGLSGCFFSMMAHAFVSSGLFMSVGIIYERYKTRSIFYYGGLLVLMPLWTIFFLVFILGNFAFPGTANFVGEFLVLLNVFAFSKELAVFLLLGLTLTLAYSLFMYVRLTGGPVSPFMRYYSDLTRREYSYLFIFLHLVIFLGLYPDVILGRVFAFMYYISG